MIFLSAYIAFSLCLGIFLAMVTWERSNDPFLRKVSTFALCMLCFAMIWPFMWVAALVE